MDGGQTSTSAAPAGNSSDFVRAALEVLVCPSDDDRLLFCRLSWCFILLSLFLCDFLRHFANMSCSCLGAKALQVSPPLLLSLSLFLSLLSLPFLPLPIFPLDNPGLPPSASTGRLLSFDLLGDLVRPLDQS